MSSFKRYDCFNKNEQPFASQCDHCLVFICPQFTLRKILGKHKLDAAIAIIH